MKNISRMVAQTTPQQVVQMGASNPPKPIGQPKFVSDETAKIVNSLFIELQAIFPAWRCSFASDEALNNAKKSWIKAFMEAEINSESQLQFGLKKARASKDRYCPSVGKFVDWCNPTAEEIGLPSKEDAYREAIANLGVFDNATWSHPAVCEAVRNTTCYALKTLTEKDSRARFYRNYAIMVERVMRGENLQVEIPKAITAVPEFRPARPEVQQSHLASMKKMVSLV